MPRDIPLLMGIGIGAPLGEAQTSTRADGEGLPPSMPLAYTESTTPSPISLWKWAHVLAHGLALHRCQGGLGVARKGIKHDDPGAGPAGCFAGSPPMGRILWYCTMAPDQGPRVIHLNVSTHSVSACVSGWAAILNVNICQI